MPPNRPDLYPPVSIPSQFPQTPAAVTRAPQMDPSFMQSLMQLLQDPGIQIALATGIGGLAGVRQPGRAAQLIPQLEEQRRRERESQEQRQFREQQLAQQQEQLTLARGREQRLSAREQREADAERLEELIAGGQVRTFDDLEQADPELASRTNRARFLSQVKNIERDLGSRALEDLSRELQVETATINAVNTLLADDPENVTYEQLSPTRQRAITPEQFEILKRGAIRREQEESEEAQLDKRVKLAQLARYQQQEILQPGGGQVLAVERDEAGQVTGLRELQGRIQEGDQQLTGNIISMMQLMQTLPEFQNTPPEELQRIAVSAVLMKNYSKLDEVIDINRDRAREDRHLELRDEVVPMVNLMLASDEREPPELSGEQLERDYTRAMIYIDRDQTPVVVEEDGVPRIANPDVIMGMPLEALGPEVQGPPIPGTTQVVPPQVQRPQVQQPEIDANERARRKFLQGR